MAALPTGTVTFLFADLEGSTRLLTTLGESQYKDVLLQYRELVRAAVRHRNGHEVDTQGDAFFVAFQNAHDAVAAAVNVQHALANRAWAEDSAVRARIGLHSGVPIVSSEGYVGLDVHRAARISGAAHGGQILVSAQTYTLIQETRGTLPSGIHLKDLGEHRLKDLAQPEHIFQVVVPGLLRDFLPLRSLGPFTNLPSLDLTSFIGRQTEMTEIKQLLSTARSVTLVGPGGGGKTRLALQVAAELIDKYGEGTWLVELGPLTDSTLVPQTVASALGLREVRDRSLLDALIDFLRPRALLLILDNCEHVVEDAAHLAAILLRDCPKLRILATSRQSLGVTGEATYRVPPLSTPDTTSVATVKQLMESDAARLFIERAVLSNPRLAITDAIVPSVVHICRSLDGIPLATELAAARVKVLSIEEIAKRLENRFSLLRGGSRTERPHHQTLRATMDWSYELLSGPERQLFERLSVFAGGFTIDAAESICAFDGLASGDVLDLVARLVDKSMLQSETSDGETRFRMLETVRVYSTDRRATSGQEDQAPLRHLDWYLRLAERAEPELLGPSQVRWLDSLEADRDNFRAALERSLNSPRDIEKGVHLAGVLGRFWQLRGYLSEGRQWLEDSLTRNVSPLVRAKAAYMTSLLVYEQGDYPRAEALCQESLALYRALGDREGSAHSLNLLGVIASDRSDYVLMNKLIEQSLSLSRASGNNWAVARSLHVIGIAFRRQRNYFRAKSLLEESVAIWRQLGDNWGLSLSLGSLGVVARLQGDYSLARSFHEESLALARQLGDKYRVASSLGSLGALLLDQGDNDGASRFLEETLALCRELGNKVDAAAALGNLAMAAARRGEYQMATKLAQDTLMLWNELNNKPAVAASFRVLGMVALAERNHQRASVLYKESLSLSVACADKLGIAWSLTGLARGAAANEQWESAAVLFGAAEALRESIGAAMPPADRPEYDREVRIVQAALKEDAFHAIWGRGRALPIEAAVRQAMGPEL